MLGLRCTRILLMATQSLHNPVALPSFAEIPMNYSYQTAPALPSPPGTFQRASVRSQLWRLLTPTCNFPNEDRCHREYKQPYSQVFIHNKLFLERLRLPRSFLPSTPPQKPGTALETHQLIQSLKKKPNNPTPKPAKILCGRYNFYLEFL